MKIRLHLHLQLQLREVDMERSIAERRALVDSLAAREDFTARLEQQLTALTTAR
jgi:hypothetical protein